MQPVPTYSEEDLSRIVAREFRGRQGAEVMRILAQYGVEDWQHETLRVRMACLKLAAGDLVRLRAAVAAACGDYRDVLASAEYPRYLRAHNADATRDAVALDWQELRDWLHRR